MIISKTPLRISLVGGGTDFPTFYRTGMGQVISTTIDKYIYVVVKERFDDLIVLHYTDNEIVNDISEIKHEIIRECLKKVNITKGIEIITLADIPSKGSGLGSSSSLAVGLLNVLYNYTGVLVTAEKLAREACEIEINILQKPIGKQDQYIAAYGGLKKFTFFPDETVIVENIFLSSEERRKLGSNILLNFTKITRKSESVLKEQDSNSNKNNTELKKLLDLCYELDYHLEKKDFDKLGLLLKENWEMKKGLSSNVTNSEIDEIVKIAISNGALGCKISGAGGGGFLLSYVPRKAQEKFRFSMNNYPELPFMLEPFGSRILFNVMHDNMHNLQG